MPRAAAAAAASMFEGDTTSFTCSASARGLLQPGLSLCCIGMCVGAKSRTLVVRPGDPGHPQPKYDPSLVVTVPTGESGGENVCVGATVRVRHQGAPRLAVVMKFNKEKRLATVDMNDPLAGRTLQYSVDLLSLDARDAMLREMFPEPADVPDRTFSPAELARYDGKTNGTNGRIYMAVNGIVYDMTSGAKFYGPNGMYGFMAGHDATLPLAKFKIDCDLLNQPWTLASLDEGERASLANYIKTFGAKYPIQGRFVRDEGENQ